MIKVNGMGWNSKHEDFAVNYRGTDFAVVLFSNRMNVYTDSENLTALPGACIILPVGAIRHYTGTEKYWADDWVAFDSDDESINQLLSSLALPISTIFYPKEPEFISNLIDNIGSEFIQILPHREMRLDALVKLLLIELSRRIQYQPNTIDPELADRERVVASRKIMLENLREDWSVDKLAQMSYLSNSRFHVIYKELFSISPKQDLIAARIKRAKFLLESGKVSVAKAASEAGYDNVYQFIRQFSAAEGMTPGTYLKLIKGTANDK